MTEASNNYDLEKSLDTLPDEVSKALEHWRMTTLNREKGEALLWAKIRLENEDITATELRSRINSSQERYDLCVEEIKAEANYQRLYEQLLAAKKRASLRTAF